MVTWTFENIGANRYALHYPHVRGFFFQRPVNTDDVLRCIKALKELDGQMLRLIPRPRPDRPVPGYPFLGFIKPTSPYRVSTQGTLWRKSALSLAYETVRIYGSSLGESVMLALQDWVSPEQRIKTLSKSKNDTVYRDLNVRLYT